VRRGYFDWICPLTVDSPILPEQFRALPDAANVVPNPGAHGSTPLQATPTALVESFRSTVTKQFRRGLILRTNSFRKRIRLCICIHEDFTKRIQSQQRTYQTATYSRPSNHMNAGMNSRNSSLCAQLLQSVKIFDDVARRNQSDEVVLQHYRYFVDSVSAHLFHCGPQFRTEIDPI